jgi:hypothetical protein
MYLRVTAIEARFPSSIDLSEADIAILDTFGLRSPSLRSTGPHNAISRGDGTEPTTLRQSLPGQGLKIVAIEDAGTER